MRYEANSLPLAETAGGAGTPWQPPHQEPAPGLGRPRWRRRRRKTCEILAAPRGTIGRRTAPSRIVPGCRGSCRSLPRRRSISSRGSQPRALQMTSRSRAKSSLKGRTGLVRTTRSVRPPAVTTTGNSLAPSARYRVAGPEDLPGSDVQARARMSSAVTKTGPAASPAFAHGGGGGSDGRAPEVLAPRAACQWLHQGRRRCRRGRRRSDAVGQQRRGGEAAG